MFSIFVLYPPGSGIMIFDIDILLSCCSIWPAKLCFNFLNYVFLFRFLPSRPPNYEFDIYIPLFNMTYPASMFGWWTGHCSKQSGISLNLRTGPTGHATLFNQWEGALVFINKQIKTLPSDQKFSKQRTESDRISHRFEVLRHIFKTFMRHRQFF